MAKIKHWKFEDGELKETWVVCGSVSAATKSEAMKKLAEYGQRCLEQSPTVKVRNGAWQLSYPNLDGGMNVDAGTEERGRCICSSLVVGRKVTDEDASFAYYASEEYRANC